MLKTITINLIDEEHEGKYSPMISLSAEGLESDLNDFTLDDRDQIVIERNDIKVQVKFPLKSPHTFDIQLDKDPHFTRIILIKEIAKLYQKIYKEEEETSTIPVETYAECYKRTGKGNPNMVNRITTDGTYGIYLHKLENIFLKKIDYDLDTNLCILDVGWVNPLGAEAQLIFVALNKYT